MSKTNVAVAGKSNVVLLPVSDLKMKFDVRKALNEDQGSGLGLAISKSLVELHGGRMRIRSTLGQGTLVVVRLPLEPHCPLAKEEAA